MIFHKIQHFFAISRLRIQWSKKKNEIKNWLKKYHINFLINKTKVGHDDVESQELIWIFQVIYIWSCWYYIAVYCQYFIFLRNDGYCKIVDVYIISSIKSVIGHVIRPPSINKRIGVLNDLVHWSFYPKTTIMLSNVAFSVVLTTKITKINSKHNKKTIYTKKQTYFFQLWVSKSNICSSKLNQYMEFFLNQQFYNFCFL